MSFLKDNADAQQYVANSIMQWVFLDMLAQNILVMNEIQGIIKLKKKDLKTTKSTSAEHVISIPFQCLQ